MAPEHPKVSIIMPVKNMERFIGEAIRSVLEQTLDDWELLIIDDASEDKTPEIVWWVSDDRIRYVRTKGLNCPATTRNIGLLEARGEYIAFLDADDMYTPTALEKLCAYLESNPECQAVYGFYQQIDERGRVLVNSRQALDSIYPLTQCPTWNNILLGLVPHQLQSLMIRKSDLIRIGLFDERFKVTSDYAFFIKLYQTHYDAVHAIPEIVFHYRVYDHSVTTSPMRNKAVVKTLPCVMDWIFDESGLELGQARKPVESMTRVFHYRYYIQMRLKFNQFLQALQLSLMAFLDTRITRADWLKHCGKLYLDFIRQKARMLDASLMESSA